MKTCTNCGQPSEEGFFCSEECRESWVEPSDLEDPTMSAKKLVIRYHPDSWTNVVNFNGHMDQTPTPQRLMEATELAVSKWLAGDEYFRLVGIFIGDAFGEPVALRILRMVREKRLDWQSVVFEMADGSVNPVTEDGDLLHPWPGGFFNWRSEELF